MGPASSTMIVGDGSDDDEPGEAMLRQCWPSVYFVCCQSALCSCCRSVVMCGVSEVETVYRCPTHCAASFTMANCARLSIELHGGCIPGYYRDAVWACGDTGVGQFEPGVDWRSGSGVVVWRSFGPTSSCAGEFRGGATKCERVTRLCGPKAFLLRWGQVASLSTCTVCRPSLTLVPQAAALCISEPRGQQPGLVVCGDRVELDMADDIGLGTRRRVADDIGLGTRRTWVWRGRRLSSYHQRRGADCGGDVGARDDCWEHGRL